jgi:hypothetical protein
MNVDISSFNYYSSDVANHCMSPVQQVRCMLSKNVNVNLTMKMVTASPGLPEESIF